MWTTGRGQHPPWILWAILFLAALLRLPGLDEVPPSLNQDEASRGYDAWAILQTGADRHGQPWPLFLESFGPGDYTAALTTYITVPFVSALGPTVLAMRLPDALLGVLTVGLLYLWLKRQTNPTIALLAAAILATDPWHIALSRTAHESGFTTFFLTLALLALNRSGLLPGVEASSEENHPPAARTKTWAFLGGLMLAANTWAYPATRLFTPLLILAGVVIYRSHYRAMWRTGATRKTLVAGAAGLLIGALPLLVTAASHPERLAARAQVTLLTQKGLPPASTGLAFIRNFAANLDPRYLFLQCDEMSGASIPGVGLHLPVLAPLLLLGIACLGATWKQDRWPRFLLLWLLLYPLPAAICSDWNPHPLRTVGGMIWFPIIAATGAHWLLTRAGQHLQRWRRPAASLAATALAANLAHFAQAYYREFPLLARPGYQAALAEASRVVARQVRDEDDFILVTNRSNQPYIYTLLSHPISPVELATLETVVADGRLGFHQVLRIGKYFFPPRDDLPEATRGFQELWADLPPAAQGLLIFYEEDPPTTPPGQILATFARIPVGDPHADGPTLVVCRWRP